MKFWCFHFEGVFTKDASEDAEKGVISSLLVQSDKYTDAEFSFLEALAERKINLIELEEHFPVDTDPDEMDSEEESNLCWIKWCEETEMAGKPTFEAFHTYPKEEVPKLETSN